MKFRHEWKHEISYSDLLVLRSRLTATMAPDSHAINGKYDIRSMYFDDIQDTALREKINGVNRREKFRIRYYNGDTSFIMLEKKSKLNDLCSKEQVPLSLQEAQAISDGVLLELRTDDKPLLSELYRKTQISGIKPKTIVDYTREPFLCAEGNVRVTLDYNIRTGLSCTDFLNPKCVTIPIRDAPIILEVKWDSYLPSFVRDIVQLTGCHTSAFSKYASCRVYG